MTTLAPNNPASDEGSTSTTATMHALVYHSPRKNAWETGPKPILVSCITACGACGFCREARYGQCIGEGGWILDHLIDGTQAEYVRVPSTSPTAASTRPRPSTVPTTGKTPASTTGSQRRTDAVHLAISNLVGRYCDAVLHCDLDTFTDCWTDDATWAIPGKGIVEGRAAIVDAFAEIRPTYRLCVQEILNSRIEPLDDTHARCTFQVRELQWRADGDGSELIGVYHDTVVVDAGRASFTHRDFELLYNGPVELTGRLRTPRRIDPSPR